MKFAQKEEMTKKAVNCMNVLDAICSFKVISFNRGCDRG